MTEDEPGGAPPRPTQTGNLPPNVPEWMKAPG